MALDNAQTVPDAINNAMQQLIAPLVAALSQVIPRMMLWTSSRPAIPT
ncbi:hypothetical protein M8494_20700 [Serratia ureilytica]